MLHRVVVLLILSSVEHRKSTRKRRSGLEQKSSSKN